MDAKLLSIEFFSSYGIFNFHFWPEVSANFPENPEKFEACVKIFHDSWEIIHDSQYFGQEVEIANYEENNFA